MAVGIKGGSVRLPMVSYSSKINLAPPALWFIALTEHLVISDGAISVDIV